MKDQINSFIFYPLTYLPYLSPLPPATFASDALHSHNGCQIELRGNGARGNGVRGKLFAATVVSALILVQNPEHFHFCDHFCNIYKYLL